MATLSTVRASTAGAAVNLALRASLFGHGGDLVDALDGGVLYGDNISILCIQCSKVGIVATYSSTSTVCLGSARLNGVVALGTPLSYSAPRTIANDVGEIEDVDVDLRQFG